MRNRAADRNCPGPGGRFECLEAEDRQAVSETEIRARTELRAERGCQATPGREGDPRFLTRIKTRSCLAGQAPHRELKPCRIYLTRDQARADVFDYIEVFYNRQRRHSHIGDVSPDQFERTSLSSQ